jgi:hypothetical protein
MTDEIVISADDREIPRNLLPDDIAPGDVMLWDDEPILILSLTDDVVHVVRSFMARRPDMNAAAHSTATAPHIVIKARR